MKSKLTVLFFLMCLAVSQTLSGSAFARQPDECHVPDGLIAELLDWIGANTSYNTEPVRQAPPRIVTCATGDIIDYAGEEMIVDEAIEGLYDFVSRTIILVEPVDLGTIEGQGLLLHELLHAVQLSNRTWPCIGGPEWEAYKLHEAWLAERGVEADFDWLVVYFQSRCPPDMHPD